MIPLYCYTLGLAFMEDSVCSLAGDENGCGCVVSTNDQPSGSYILSVFLSVLVSRSLYNMRSRNQMFDA